MNKGGFTLYQDILCFFHQHIEEFLSTEDILAHAIMGEANILSVCTGLLFFKNCFKVIFFHENYFFLL